MKDTAKFLLSFLAVFFISFNYANATITYVRDPAIFNAGHGTTITVDSDDYATDFQDCVVISLGAGQALFDNPFGPIEVQLPDDGLFTVVGFESWQKVTDCIDYDHINWQQSELETLTSDNGDYPTYALRFIFSTFDQNAFIEGSDFSTTTLSVNNNGTYLFNGFILFFIPFFFILWFFKRRT